MINIERLKKIVKEASSLMMNDVFEISEKEGVENIVTSSDIAVQNFLCDKLAQEMPMSGFLCEEADINDCKHEYVWVIDPIDGTANYARDIDQCAICVGLLKQQEIKMSVIYMPRTNQMIWAERGAGAWCNNRSIHVSDRSFKNSIMSTALPVYHKEYTDLCSSIISNVFVKINDIRRFGAASPELCYLAMGRTELYYEHMLSPWDFAAASLIVEEAGGCLCDLEGKPLNMQQPSGVLAANSINNLQNLLEIVKQEINHY